jgi:hypothetical protein
VVAATLIDSSGTPYRLSGSAHHHHGSTEGFGAGTYEARITSADGPTRTARVSLHR